jgi:hypothetical protein
MLDVHMCVVGSFDQSSFCGALSKIVIGHAAAGGGASAALSSIVISPYLHAAPKWCTPSHHPIVVSSSCTRSVNVPVLGRLGLPSFSDLICMVKAGQAIAADIILYPTACSGTRSTRYFDVSFCPTPPHPLPPLLIRRRRSTGYVIPGRRGRLVVEQVEIVTGSARPNERAMISGHISSRRVAECGAHGAAGSDVDFNEKDLEQDGSLDHFGVGGVVDCTALRTSD